MDVDVEREHKSTLHELNERVQEGLTIAAEVAEGDQELVKLVADVMEWWNTALSGILIAAVGLHAMKYRTKEEIAEQLHAILGLREKKQREMAPFTFNDFCKYEH